MQSTPARRIARIHPDGTRDASFSGGFPEDVYCLAVQPDGRILAGGIFPGGIARLLPDGTRGDSMATLAFGVNDLALQADGRCLAAGTGSNAGGPVLFNTDGSVDPAFHPDTSSAVLHLALQADGKVLCMLEGGGVILPHLARLDNDPASTLLKTEGSSSIRWHRSGTAPEVRDVTFDVKPDNSPDWIPLGAAHRIPGGWELSGLTLPVSGSIRALGLAGGSLMESVRPILTAFEFWRLQYFNISTNTGDAAGNADPDHDGLTNFTEFAFGLNPVDRTSSALPEFKNTGSSFSATFTAPEEREDVIYGAEWSPSMLPGTWMEVPDTGTGREHVFSVDGSAGKGFVRFVLRMR